MFDRRKLLSLCLTIGCAALALAQGAGDPNTSVKSDIELVERVLSARREYQKSLEALRLHYLNNGDVERGKWAEDELIHYHRVPKHAFILDLDVPPKTLQGNTHVTAANKLYMRAMEYKDRGWGTDYIDNQRRAEILLQQLLSDYPQCDRISDAAYQLGDIYESKQYKQYKRAAAYFERSFQWNPTTKLDARMRAARIYDRQLHDREKAAVIYREISQREIDPRQQDEAKRRLQEMSGPRK